MRKDAVLSGTWKGGSAEVEVKLSLIIFAEDESTIAYCPALNLNGYGQSEAEARDSFEVVLSEYLRYTLNKKSLGSDLQKFGWKIHGSLKKPPTPPTMAEMLSNNEEFSRIFNNHDFKKTDATFSMPSFAE